MDILLVSLRLIHIVAGVVWFGLGAAQVFVLVPATRSTGLSGYRFLKGVFNTTPLATAFGITALLATLAGLALYIFANSASHFSGLGNAVLGVGAIAGLGAFGHGAMATGRYTGEFAKTLNEQLPDDDKPLADSALAAIQTSFDKLATHSRISFWMMLVALLCMGLARYL